LGTEAGSDQQRYFFLFKQSELQRNHDNEQYAKIKFLSAEEKTEFWMICC
jgi:hypothetical protein